MTSPYAIEVVAGILQGISAHTQVILATQSTLLVNLFEPEQIVVVERPGRGSRYQRLPVEKLTDWLDEYSVAELWEKNVIGGTP